MSIDFSLGNFQATNLMDELLQPLSVEPIVRAENYRIKHAWHQLVVLGNGFDLECGLDSRFADFMKARIPQMKVDDFRYDTWKSLFDDASLTVWDFILRDNRDAYWYNIEQSIAEWVKAFASDASRRNSVAAKLQKKISAFPFNPFVTVASKDGSRPAEEQTDEEFCLGNIARTFLVRNGAERGMQVYASDIIEFLKQELARFEQEFATYLRHLVKDDSSYAYKANRLLSCMIKDETPCDERLKIETSILNFNYTNPFAPEFVNASINLAANIHGNLDSEIIFGIDGTDLMESGAILPFTKTYRVVLMGSDLPCSLVRPAPLNGFGIGTEMIKFYGHSLGEADYAYFQSLFDSVNLYGGSTKLVFYFKSSKAEARSVAKENAAKVEMTQKVSRLLSTYGHTLDNKDHGKNLMHKLMIEGRLAIRTVPEWPDMVW